MHQSQDSSTLGGMEEKVHGWPNMHTSVNIPSFNEGQASASTQSFAGSRPIQGLRKLRVPGHNIVVSPCINMKPLSFRGRRLSTCSIR